MSFLQKHMFVREDESSDSFSEDSRQITAMIDVLDVNAFEIRGPEFSIRGVYPLTAMMNSVCCPNTQVGW